MKRIIFLLLLIIPALLWATTPYEKDNATGIVAVDAEATVDAIQLHDSFSRYFVPDGENFRVLFECMGQTKVVASGIAVAKTAGKICPVRIKVRIEPESIIPEIPVIEVPVDEVIK